MIQKPSRSRPAGDVTALSGPKPPPPASLLLRNQSWVVVEARGWWVLTTYQPCGFQLFEVRCDRQAIASSPAGDDGPQYCCDEHMGSVRWVSAEGLVMQWRADPPWTQYKTRAPLNRWPNRREKADSMPDSEPAAVGA